MMPLLGTSCVEIIPAREDHKVLEHGSSLELMAKATSCFNDEFNSDASGDWEKWTKRYGGDVLTLYYAVLMNGSGAVEAALRAVVDNGGTPHNIKRIVIDYVRTNEIYRGQGSASMLTSFVLELAAAHGANLFVLATEESSPFWMEKRFVLEDNPAMNRRFNVFSDTHLLRLVDNSIDLGEVVDDASSSEDEGSGSDDDSNDEANDSDLQAALIASMAGM